MPLFSPSRTWHSRVAPSGAHGVGPAYVAAVPDWSPTSPGRLEPQPRASDSETETEATNAIAALRRAANVRRLKIRYCTLGITPEERSISLEQYWSLE
jgi:hypothetical protein